ncbi:MAG TPA: hypothetical protein VGE76_24720, partial [Opitutaceae bacterium]
MKITRTLLVISIAASATAAQWLAAQTAQAVQPAATAAATTTIATDVAATPATLPNETTVTLDIGFGIRPVGPSRLTVPV